MAGLPFPVTVGEMDVSSARTGYDPQLRPLFHWWMPGLVLLLGAMSLVLFADGEKAPAGARWWMVTMLLHLPLLLILLFQVGGLVERVGYWWHGRASERPGRLPDRLPRVCVQLPMFNEHAVARRAIEAACALEWPSDRLSVQVLDDSTDADTRALVREICDERRAATGVDCWVVPRPDRQGYKAGALEVGRTRTSAEFIAVFDADFVPPKDFLHRAMPHFYLEDGSSDSGLAMVQTQWGHLNHDESPLTRAQSLWVDDHHTLQMSWRSARWRFVNFTGTAGIWRASAIEVAGGWRAASLVEDCELSFRVLFAGFRTAFVKEIVVPAELPATYTAYKAQQKRWTQGWAQLQRLHLGRLLWRFRTSPPRRLHLIYHMCVAWQWPAWALWVTLPPLLIMNGYWLGRFGAAAGALAYLLPTVVCTVVAAVTASVETRHTYPAGGVWRRITRAVPHAVINTGMLPHQFCAFAEGLFGPLYSEFERTPKKGNGCVSRDRARVHWPYVLTEAMFVAYQLVCAVLFTVQGLIVCALGAAFLAACVLAVAFFYGDDDGRVCFRFAAGPRSKPGR